ncbi:SufD family Fe-S cluster assembly protein, partial [Candidatus Collierbacteria bacterium]|nr:SufD family Fe-S cluster assembly protein [Candidatus Collierbacteria bacterium]
MSRFAKIKQQETKGLEGLGGYKLGHHDEIDYVYKEDKGLSEEMVRRLSAMKNEPKWMLDIRLKALAIYQQMPIPRWGGDISEINFEDIHYYLKPVNKEGKNWDEVPEAIKRTFDKIGVPQAERKLLAGVKTQYDSEVIYGSLKEALAKKGVVFLGMDEGLRQYPELISEYFGKVVPIGDNKIAALNTAVWSGGSFIYVPAGVEVGLPLQAYFRINAERAGQFERTLIIAEEGSKIHYVEGCFLAGAKIQTSEGIKPIEVITKDDKVLTHKGRFKKVNYLQERLYSGKIFKIRYWGDSTAELKVTDEHPLLVVKRRQKNERNHKWYKEWLQPEQVENGDYLVVPREEGKKNGVEIRFEIEKWGGKKRGFEKIIKNVPNIPEFYRLVGYYLAEGSISSGSYLNFSFANEEREYIDDVKRLVKTVFGIEKCLESRHKKNNGTSVVFCCVDLCRIFKNFGQKNYLKNIPDWMALEDEENIKELMIGWYRGDGNYYDKKHHSGRKEVFRINTTSEALAKQGRRILTRLGIGSFVNARERKDQGRRMMFTLGVTGEWMIPFGEMVGVEIDTIMNEKKRATKFGIDENYLYLPIRSIQVDKVKNKKVYNFGVNEDESYIAEGVVVHNCSAPAYSSGSLHAAVVEIIVKKGARVQYTTVQNWYKNVYNLVTKRAMVGEEAEMRWLDGNLGSRLTMKYPACVLAGRKAKGETLSIAMAGAGQHQDAGAKMIHLAAETSSQILSKSISMAGGRASYRGL